MANSVGPLTVQPNAHGNSVFDSYTNPETGGYQIVDISKQLGDSTSGYEKQRIIADMIRLKNAYIKKIPTSGRTGGMGPNELKLWTKIVSTKIDRAARLNKMKVNAGIKPKLDNHRLHHKKKNAGQRGFEQINPGPDYQVKGYIMQGVFDPVLLYIDSGFPSNDTAGDVPQDILYKVAHPMGLTQAFIAKSTFMNIIKTYHRADHVILYAHPGTSNVSSKDYITGGTAKANSAWGGTSLATGDEMIRLADSTTISNFLEFKVIETNNLYKQNLSILEIVPNTTVSPKAGQMRISKFISKYYPALNGKPPSDIPGLLKGQKLVMGTTTSGPLLGHPVEWHVEYNTALRKNTLIRAGWEIIEEFADAAALKRSEAHGWARPPKKYWDDRPLLDRLKADKWDGVKLTKRNQAARLQMGDYNIKQTIIFDHSIDKIRKLLLPSPHLGMYAVSNSLKIQASVMSDAGLSVKDGLLVRKNVNSGVIDQIVNQIAATDIQKVITDEQYAKNQPVQADGRYRNEYKFDNDWVVMKLDAPTGEIYDGFNLNGDNVVDSVHGKIPPRQHYVVTPKAIWSEAVLNSGQIWSFMNVSDVAPTRSLGIDPITGSLASGGGTYMVHPHIEFVIDSRRNEFELSLMVSNTDSIKTQQALYEAVGFEHYSFIDPDSTLAQGKSVYERVSVEMRHALYQSDIVKSTLSSGSATIRQSGHTIPGIRSAQLFWQEAFAYHMEMSYDYLWRDDITWRDITYSTETVYDLHGDPHQIVMGTSEGFQHNDLTGTEMRKRFMTETGSLSKDGILLPFTEQAFDSDGLPLKEKNRYEVQKLSPEDVKKFVRPYLIVNSDAALKELTDIQKAAVRKANAEFSVKALTKHTVFKTGYDVSNVRPAAGAEIPIGHNGGIAYMSPSDFLRMAFPLEYKLNPTSMNELDGLISELQQDFNFYEDLNDRKGLSVLDEAKFLEIEIDLNNSLVEKAKITASWELYQRGVKFDSIPQLNIRFDPTGGIKYGAGSIYTTSSGEAVVAQDPSVKGRYDKWAHDGRHRALALEYGGVKLMPVLLVDSKGNVPWQQLGQENWPKRLISEKYFSFLGETQRGSNIIDFPISWEQAQPGGPLALPYNLDEKVLKQWIFEHQGPRLRELNYKNPRQRELGHLATKFVELYGPSVDVASKIRLHRDWLTLFGPETEEYIKQRITHEINEAYGLHERDIASRAFVPPMDAPDIMKPYTIAEYNALGYTTDAKQLGGTKYTDHDLAKAIHTSRGRLAFDPNPNAGQIIDDRIITDFIELSREMKQLNDKLPEHLVWNEISKADSVKFKTDDITVRMAVIESLMDEMFHIDSFIVYAEPSRVRLNQPLVVERYGGPASDPLHLYSFTVVDPTTPIGTDPGGKLKQRFIIPEGQYVYLPLGLSDRNEVLLDGTATKEHWTSSSAKVHNVIRSHTYDYVKINTNGDIEFHDINKTIVGFKKYDGKTKYSFTIDDVSIDSIRGQGVDELWSTFKTRLLKLKAHMDGVKTRGGYIHPVMQDYINKHHAEMNRIEAAKLASKLKLRSLQGMQIGLGLMGIGGAKTSTRVMTGGIFLGASVFFQEHYFNRTDAQAYDEKHPDQPKTWTDDMEREYQRYDWMWMHLWLTKVAHRLADDDLSNRGLLELADKVLATTGWAVTKAYNELPLKDKMNLWMKERFKILDERWGVSNGFQKVMLYGLEGVNEIAAVIEQSPTLSWKEHMRKFKPVLWQKYEKYMLTKQTVETLTKVCENLPKDSVERNRCEIELLLYTNSDEVKVILENPPRPEDLPQINLKTGEPWTKDEAKNMFNGLL